MTCPAHSASLTQLCDSRGQLNPDAIGASAGAMINCAIPGRYGRRKRWNHWCITTPNWSMVIAQADFDYIGYASVHFVDLLSGQAAMFDQYRLFARDCHLPDQPLQSHEFNHANLQLRVSEQDGRTGLSINAADATGLPLQAVLDFQRPAHLHGANLVVPIDQHNFHAASRQLGLPCTGSVQLGQQIYPCVPGKSFASQDFGRGVWPLNSRLTRAVFAAPGGIAGHFGSGWAESSGHSENHLWFGGQLHSIDSPMNIAEAHSNLFLPRSIASADEQVQLSFTPLQHHVFKRRFGIFYVDSQQWFGHFDGLLRNAAGERVPVRKASGWLAETQSRW
jgi:hypothetical protein